MSRTWKLPALLAGAALSLVAVPVLAQDDAEMMAETIEVSGIEYAFVGLPTSVPAGTEITLRNDGVELHEIFIARKADGVTESFEELMAMGEEAMAAGLVTQVGEGPLVVAPGAVSEGSLRLEQEGEYIALCFIPQGFDPAAIAAAGVDLSTLGPDMDIASLPEEVQAIMANPEHFQAGMVQTFTVTPEGTEVGPLPVPMDDMGDESEDMAEESEDMAEKESE